LPHVQGGIRKILLVLEVNSGIEGTPFKRDEALALLREISKRCRKELIVDSVSLMPYKQPAMHFTDDPESRFRIYLQTSLTQTCESSIRSILQGKGLEMTNVGHFVIIQKPENR
jgi:hypothetical protein